MIFSLANVIPPHCHYPPSTFTCPKYSPENYPSSSVDQRRNLPICHHGTSFRPLCPSSPHSRDIHVSDTLLSAHSTLVTETNCHRDQPVTTSPKSPKLRLTVSTLSRRAAISVSVHSHGDVTDFCCNSLLHLLPLHRSLCFTFVSSVLFGPYHPTFGPFSHQTSKSR